MKTATRNLVGTVVHPSTLLVIFLTISVVALYRLPTLGFEQRYLPQVVFEYYSALPIPLILWPVAFFHVWGAFDRVRVAPVALRYRTKALFALKTTLIEVVPRVLALQIAMFATVAFWSFSVAPRGLLSLTWQPGVGDLPQCFPNVVCEPVASPWIWVASFIANDLALFSLLWVVMIALDLRGFEVEKIRLVANAMIIISSLMSAAQTFLWVGINWASNWIFNPIKSWSHMGSLFTGTFFVMLVFSGLLLWLQIYEWRKTAPRKLGFSIRFGLYAFLLGVGAGITTQTDQDYAEAALTVLGGRGLVSEESSWASFLLLVLLFAIPSVVIGHKTSSIPQSLKSLAWVTVLGPFSVSLSFLALGRNMVGDDDIEQLAGLLWILPIIFLQNIVYFLLGRLLLRGLNVGVAVGLLIVLELVATSLRGVQPYLPIGLLSFDLWTESSTFDPLWGFLTLCATVTTLTAGNALFGRKSKFALN